jgi:nucleoid DNA-binding protein
MTKKDVIEQIHKRTGLPKLLVKNVVKTTFNIIKQHLEKGDEVKIVHFGKWQPILRKTKRVKHPTTQEIIEIPPYTKIIFKSSRQLQKL